MWRRSPHDREIFSLALPALGALAAEPIYLLTDTAIVGHLGTNQLAGLAIASAVLLTVHSLMIFLAYGTTSLVGRLVGSGDVRGAHAQGVAALWLALGAGAVAAVFLSFTGERFISLFDATAAVRDHASTYLLVSLAGLPAMLSMLSGAGYLRGLGDTVRPLYVAVATAVANVVIEVVLVFGFDMGIAGSALSTVLAQWGGALAFIALAVRGASGAGVRLLPSRERLARYGSVGARLFVRTAALRSVFLASVAIAAQMGTVEVASHQIAIEVLGLTALILDAVAIAGQVMISQAAGRGDRAGALAASKRMVALTIMVGVVVGAVGAAFAPLLARVFTSDAQVVALTTFLLLCVAALQPFNAVPFALDGVLIGAGDLTFLAWAMMGSAAAFGIAGGAVAWSGWGIGWLWGALFVFTLARAVPLWLRLRAGAWLKTRA